MLEDVDTVPLQRVYYQDRTDKRENGHLLAVGAEVLNGTLDEGKFPMSTITAEGYTFKKFINPHDLDDESLVKSWIDLKITNHGVEHARGGWMEHSQAINNPPGRYSDESMIWALLTQWSDKNITHVHRAVDINSDWIDRDWWNIDTGKLLYGRYIACNFLRPIWRLNMADFNQIKPIIGYIYDDESFEDIFVTELQEGF
jgi:hypothetical protein